MKTTLLLFAGLITGFTHAQTSEYLDINQVKARVNSGGDLHWDPTTYNHGYECPKGSNKNWGTTASIWFGGLDIGGQLHLAAQTYHQSGVDFWPGPLTTNDATTDSAVVAQYNRVWKLNKSDIDDFITNFANGNVQNGSFIPVADLISWPGNGDISQNQDSQLAPYFDTNGDNVYDPMGSGDYPLIKGDQAIYTIFNDNYLLHQSSAGKAIGAEIHLMAYAYGPCSITSSNSFLNYTTFYNYKIINRSSFAFNDFHSALFNDQDISTKDLTGCDVLDHYGYTYNTTVSSNPAIGVVQLKGPINTTNIIDDDNDGITDEPFEQMSMTGFMSLNNEFPGVPSAITDPNNGIQYYQCLKNLWKDGTPLTCGGNGYGGSTQTFFAFSGNTYTNSQCGPSNWTETISSTYATDKRFVMNTGPILLQPGAVNELEYAYITSFDSITNDPLGKLDTDVQNLHAIYNSSLNQCLTTGIKEQNLQNQFTIAPNPTNGILNINSRVKHNIVKMEITDALGKTHRSEEFKEFSQTSLDISYLSSGIYFVKLISGNEIMVKKIIKE